MKRTNIHLHEYQRAGLSALAVRRKTTPAVEVREAVDTHLATHKKKKTKHFDNGK